MGIPISGAREIDKRWEAIKPILVDAAGRLLDDPR